MMVPEKDMHPEIGMPMHDTVQNSVHKVYFRAGLLAARELLAREHGHRIRDTWWGILGPDPGNVRLNSFDELAKEMPDGSIREALPDPSVEALPLALAFVNTVVDPRKAARETGPQAWPQDP